MCFHVLGCYRPSPSRCFAVAAARDKPNEQRAALPQAGRAQSSHRRLLQKPAQGVHAGGRQDVRRVPEQAAAERPGVRLLRPGRRGDVGQRESKPPLVEKKKKKKV